MKKLLIFLLLLVSTQSFANWLYLTNSDIFDLYIDKSTIINSKNNKRVWLMYDFHEIQKLSTPNSSYLSTSMYVEFSCIDKSYRFLQLLNYEKNLAFGNVVDNTKGSGSESFIPPNTVFNRAFQFVCNK